VVWALSVLTIGAAASAAGGRARPGAVQPTGTPLPGTPHGADGSAAEDALTAAPLATVPWLDHRQHYADSLISQTTGLSADAAAWLGAAERALNEAVTLTQPYVEHGRFQADRPDAAGFRLPVIAGERLLVEVAVSGESAGAAPLFVEIMGETAMNGAGILEHAIREDGFALVRVQPAIGLNAAYTLRISRAPALLFPVRGSDSRAVVGRFFEPRDGGARRHQGIDIKAPRGTPVIAAADGTIERVEETPIGGRVVWLRENDAPRLHFYAHLDTQLVRTGAHVRAGTVLGTVGTTGNAVPTMPHLHFEVQVDGRHHDPQAFLGSAASRRRPAALLADTSWLGSSARTRMAGVALRTSTEPAATGRPLPRRAPLEIVAASGRHFRVRTADGEHGYVAAALLERPAARP
jgi:peptidoglycan LD-endopeptidase LytH